MYSAKKFSKVLVESTLDPSSRSIAAHIRRKYGFSAGEQEGIWKKDDIIMLATDKRHLDYDALPRDLETIGVSVSTAIFLSKHSSIAKVKSLTVHATGNFGVAQLGGRDKELSAADPKCQSSALRIMASKPVEGFNITFEATHHGPFILIPSFYIEIGTEKQDWENQGALDTVSAAVMESSSNGSGGFVGIGGGHYSPKITAASLERGINVGHIISKHAQDSLSTEQIIMAAKRTHCFSGFIMDRKGTRGPVREMVSEARNKLSCELLVV